MKSKYLILVGLLLVSDVSANALISIGKALVIYTSKSAVVVKKVAPAVKVVPNVVPNAVPNAVPTVKPIPKVIPPKVTPKMIPKSTKVNKDAKVVPNAVPKSAVDNSPDIPNMSPVIIWNKLENDCKPNCSKNTTK